MISATSEFTMAPEAAPMTKPDGQIDHVTLERELSEFLQHRFLLCYSPVNERASDPPWQVNTKDTKVKPFRFPARICEERHAERRRHVRAIVEGGACRARHFARQLAVRGLHGTPARALCR